MCCTLTHEQTGVMKSARQGLKSHVASDDCSAKVFIALSESLTDDANDRTRKCVSLTQTTITTAPMLSAIGAPFLGWNPCTSHVLGQAPFSAMVHDAHLMSNPTASRFAMQPMHAVAATSDVVAESEVAATGSQNMFDKASEISDHQPSSSSAVIAMSFQQKHIEEKIDHLTEKHMKHNLKECTPCFYFAFRADGCWKGDDCEFCHVCDKKQCRRREKERAKALKRSTKLSRENGSDTKGVHPIEPSSN